MTSVGDFFKTNLIPYNKHLNKKMENVYMTPSNIIIICHSFSSIHRGRGFHRMIEKIKNFNAHVYLYIDNIKSETEYTRFIAELAKYNIDSTMLTIITDINDIITIPGIMDYSFGVCKCGALWTLVMTNMHEIIRGRYIIVPSVIYNRAIVIMEDHEIERLHTYNIIVSDDYYPNLVYIIRDTHNNKEPFIMQIKFTTLGEEHRYVTRLIEGVTMRCESCSKMIYVDKTHLCDQA